MLASELTNSSVFSLVVVWRNKMLIDATWPRDDKNQPKVTGNFGPTSMGCWNSKLSY